ncbi:hypothetical protein [Dyadobacter psychrotolerans]|uniref:AAA family ATPase n=1 Tax=Dyadobacter psychrotolerans TaxID=2541721 RepID=A0A4V2Z454_9BACT|nr:hypothetical protein [Dyadobacter psychrotolerans]TDE15278.1 hypothetical protein E0F88_12200 [Dyadobacter psychrotolerans]
MSIVASFLQDEQPDQPPEPIKLTVQPTVSQQFRKKGIFDARITLKTQIKELVPVVKINGSNFAVRGDISFVSGAPKAGKTNIINMMLASCFVPANFNPEETLLIESVNAGKNPVIYIDTEQPKPYTMGIVRKVMEIAGLEKEPENLYVFNLREYSVEERIQWLEQCFEEFENEHLYFIDGVTDFVTSVNNEEESNKFINHLMKKSSEKDTSIILAIHENPNGGKYRGHIGSEAERKCGGAISIQKDREKQLHWIQARYLRGTSDFEAIYFQWNHELKRFALADESVKSSFKNERSKSAEERKRDELHAAMKNLFGGFKTLDKSQAQKTLANILSCSIKTCERKVASAIQFGIISYNDENKTITINE